MRPTGPPQPAPGADAAWQQATTLCGEVGAYRGELQMTARLDGSRIPRVRLGMAIDGNDAIGLEARVVGSPVFTLGGAAGSATLWLREGNRVIRAPAADIIEALIGVPLAPARLLALLSGCVSTDLAIGAAERYGDLVRIETSDAAVYLERREARWTTRAGEFGPFLVDYRRVEEGWPRALTIASRAGEVPAVSISLDVRDFTVNPVLPPALFIVSVPPGAEPASLEELRASGPLGGR